MMSYFILGVLGVWRVTHLLHAEQGPWQAAARLRRWVGDGGIGQAMDCFQCLSLWTAMPFAALIGQGWMERALLWPALSAGAIALNLALQRLMPTAVRYFEDEPEREASHVQLWETGPDSAASTSAPDRDRAPASTFVQR